MIHLLRLKNVPIFDQLQIEEALLRTDNRNWCIINEGSPPAIVMGVSGKPEELVHLDKANIPIIKRFSGGGTVVVDHNTVFASFIFEKDLLPIKPYPEPILEWSADFYREAFSITNFALQENDYVIGDLKCGGNAQYLSKNRWVHHTTFLWDYTREKMNLLKMPKRQPAYREQREHGDFLTKLKKHISSPESVADKIAKKLHKEFKVQEENTLAVSGEFPDHRRSTALIN